MKLKQLSRKELAVVILYFGLYFLLGLSMISRQPFNDPPDELNRYRVPLYIAEYGTLPNGYEESIRIPGYGFSYAFQPILPYMLQGYCMRLVKHFTADTDVLLYTARLVNFVFGLVMAVFLLFLSKKWFQNKYLQYVFCFFVLFLPQSIFLHTYVNTDSCSMMSIAIILYGLTCGLEDHFSYRSCVILSIGIILCAMSYYNAYGFILSSILLFFAHYLSVTNGQISFDTTHFLRKGILISALVLAGIGWWFIRSYLLYDGDFLGLHARDLCAELYADEYLKPGMRETYQTLGYTILTTLTESDFSVLSINSLICMFGPMSLLTALWVYRFYKLWFVLGLTGCLIPLSQLATVCKASRDKLTEGIRFPGRRSLTLFFHFNMILCMFIPLALSLIYSYYTDLQPQGRYLMPMLIPLCYYSVRGLEKVLQAACMLVEKGIKQPVSSKSYNRLLTGVCVSLIFLIVLALCITIYGYAYPAWDASEQWEIPARISAQMIMQTMPPLESLTIFCMVS